MTNKREPTRREQRAYDMGFEYAFWYGSFDEPKRPAPPPPKPNAWHEVLGVSPDATYEEAQTAYRALARRLHPDMGGTQLLFIQIQEAWEQAQKIKKG